ncbi:MAG: toprim domain-containing protein, partial [Bacilli bacterium]|nr:toprim domain-containing protein [Bacilli bacterium]
MKLVIVESPAKCQTIGKYLGNDYIVMASYGHIRDLSTTGKGGLGVDIERGFIPTYVNDKKKEDIIKELKKKAKNADEVILATDPDREGEAIAWHLANVLELPIETTKRLEFHEITKTAIENAISNYRTIDMNLVQSQECRRILDRIVGFKLTGLLKKKIKMESAGRVQSATLKLIIEHEKEIDSFIPEDYWIIYGTVQNEDGILEIDLKSQNGQK